MSLSTLVSRTIASSVYKNKSLHPGLKDHCLLCLLFPISCQIVASMHSITRTVKAAPIVCWYLTLNIMDHWYPNVASMHPITRTIKAGPIVCWYHTIYNHTLNIKDRWSPHCCYPTLDVKDHWEPHRLLLSYTQCYGRLRSPCCHMLWIKHSQNHTHLPWASKLPLKDTHTHNLHTRTHTHINKHIHTRKHTHTHTCPGRLSCPLQ
jgi:hypothetical protein